MLTLLCSILSALAMGIDYGPTENPSLLTAQPVLDGSRIVSLLLKDDAVLQTTILTIALYGLYVLLDRHRASGTKRYALPLGLFFAFTMVFGKSYDLIDSWNLVFGSIPNFVLSLIGFAGYGILFTKLIAWFLDASASGRIVENLGRVRGVAFLEEKLTRLQLSAPKQVLLIWGGLLVLWSPYLILHYPGIIVWDTGTALSEYFGFSPLTNLNPLFQTYLMGSVVTFGRFLGNADYGIFLYGLGQFLGTSFLFAFGIRYLGKLNIPFAIRALFFILVALVPIFPRYAVTLGKDMNYSMFMIAFMLLIMELIRKPENILKSRFPMKTLLFLTVFMICCTRSNGVHVILLTAPFLIAALQPEQNYPHGDSVSPRFSSFSEGNRMATRALGLEGSTIQESLSIPFQQTARYLYLYSDEVTREEQAAINRVLDCEALAKNYRPEISDPVKRTYRPGSSADLSAYFRTWGRMFFKHPGAYFEATFNNVFGYFYPNDLCKVRPFLFWQLENLSPFPDITRPESLNRLAKNFYTFTINLRSFPVFGIFLSMGAYVWGTLLAVFALFASGNRKFAVVALPALITLLICMASPVNNYMRYGLPILYGAPFLLSLCFMQQKNA